MRFVVPVHFIPKQESLYSLLWYSNNFFKSYNLQMNISDRNGMLP